ncbi:acyltransferase [Bradyrhizobium sp. dw_411]|uniref:acyltransferase family protein n=1 Tax=Bradyrhizobium sp. dw_411 TaxID=2720082 RepID=UPI001BCCA809|nr:acyltransferase [Bradyrhizobium sp. dw_411]
MTEKPAPPATKKLLGLEALRFAAAFGVLIYHYQHFAYLADQPADVLTSNLPLYGMLHLFYEAGTDGVWIFWCTSGFIFFWKYRDAIFDRSMQGWTFFVFRLSRLYPLHFATLLVVAILQSVYFHSHGYFFVYQNNDVRHFFLQIFMASEWGLERGVSFNGPIWSISVEVLVYAIFFLMLRFVTKSALLNVVVITVCLNFSGQIFACLAFFYAGGLAAIVRRSIASTSRVATIERTAWSAMAAILLLIFWLQPPISDSLFLLIFTPLLLFCLSRDIAVSAFIQALLEAAGNMTYSSYLLQFPIQLLIASAYAISGNPIPFYSDWFFVIFVTSTFTASYFTYRYFEAPAQAVLRKHLLTKRERHAPAERDLLSRTLTSKIGTTGD